jgi:uncharacterized membrane protein YgdD (TMEM256/DUF423 family)
MADEAENRNLSPRLEWLFHFAGWLLFTGSALFFCLSALKSGDILALIGGVLFLLACIVFLIPVWRTRPS